ncbi:hypothetical protein P152DRAFT_283849 [Eremomyces bilateralis CBS 781.70]|uniref:Uncharacterized protein n=1 Tax=Eremomyces bilateralis CBS 781.70 TaxID=1392243 RepID=A0A6G1FQB3_9PEZI|nr:uncharacterized protein P152DRAFT_283849 [Eremomyces bilateralis CBS 781.70]KAF1807918.1 hypothetical protein P152DRAFT_283849 [Eremomyces bilateralis CBS 781.70]
MERHLTPEQVSAIRAQHPGANDTEIMTRLLTTLGNTQTQNSELQQQLNRQAQQLQAMDARLAGYSEQNRVGGSGGTDTITPSPPIAPDMPQSPPIASTKSIIPKPSEFGGDRKEYMVWRRKVENKMKYDRDVARMGDGERVAYLQFFLVGEAAKYMEHFVAREEAQMRTPQVPDALLYLDKRYKDLHAA